MNVCQQSLSLTERRQWLRHTGNAKMTDWLNERKKEIKCLKREKSSCSATSFKFVDGQHMYIIL